MNTFVFLLIYMHRRCALRWAAFDAALFWSTVTSFAAFEADYYAHILNTTTFTAFYASSSALVRAYANICCFYDENVFFS